MKLITDHGEMDRGSLEDFLEKGLPKKGGKIPGGLAEKEKKTEKDFSPQAIAQGIKVEMEHTKDKKVAKEIAMDHLTEDPKYYQKLEGMESKPKDKVEQAILQFLEKNPKPSDKQVHALAEKLGMDEHKFEERVYALLGKKAGLKKATAPQSPEEEEEQEAKKEERDTGEPPPLPAMKKGGGVTEWANQFMGTPMYEQALQCLKDRLGVAQARDKFYANEVPWQERDQWDGKRREAYAAKRDKERQKFRENEEGVMGKMRTLEAQLVDYRIKEAKSLNKGEPMFGPSPLEDLHKSDSLEALAEYAEGNLEKAIYIGPRGGKWLDPKHTIPWKPEGQKKQAIKKEEPKKVEAPKEAEAKPQLPDTSPESGEKPEAEKKVEAAGPEKAEPKVESSVVGDKIGMGDTIDIIEDTEGDKRNYRFKVVSEPKVWVSPVHGDAKYIKVTLQKPKGSKKFEGRMWITGKNKGDWEVVEENNKLKSAVPQWSSFKHKKVDADAPKPKGPPKQKTPPLATIGDVDIPEMSSALTSAWHRGQSGGYGAGKDYASLNKFQRSAAKLIAKLDKAGIDHEEAAKFHEDFAVKVMGTPGNRKQVLPSLPHLSARRERAEMHEQLADWHRKMKDPEFRQKVYEVAGIKMKKSGVDWEDNMSGIESLEEFAKGGGPFIGPRGGKWADAKHTIPWDEKRSASGKKQKEPREQADSEAARELTLYIENDADLYRQMFIPAVKNLVNKMASGKYDHAQATKLFNYLATEGAKKYAKEYSSPGDAKVIFNPATRMAAAKQLADSFHEEAKLGGYDEYLNKKNKKAVGTLEEGKEKKPEGGGEKKAKKESGVRSTMTDETATGAQLITEAKAGETVSIHAKSGFTAKFEKQSDGSFIQRNEGHRDDGKKFTKDQLMDKLSTARDVSLRSGKAKKSMGIDTWLQTQSIDPTIEEALEKAYQGELEEDMELEDFLEKADGSGGLPTGEPKLGGGKEQGGPLAGKGKTSGSGDSAATPGQGASVPKKQKLSEDDEEDEKNMKPHKKPIEKIRRSLDGTAMSQREAIAHEHAQEVSRLQKGADDVTVGVGVAPPAEVEPEPIQAQSWRQKNPDSMVLYSDEADQAAAALMKSDQDFYPQGAPKVTRDSVLLHQQKQCPACEKTMAKSLAVCPHCGAGALTHEPIPGMTLEEDVAKSEGKQGPGLRPARREADLYLPNGVNLDDE